MNKLIEKYPDDSSGYKMKKSSAAKLFGELTVVCFVLSIFLLYLQQLSQ
jgi:hypothetical protein